MPIPMKERDEEITKIIALAEIVINQLPNSTSIHAELSQGKIDLDLSDEIAGVVMTAFTCMRKESGDTAGSNKYLAYKATINGHSISIQTIVSLFKALNTPFNFLVATPIAELVTLFKAFFDEVRTGVTKFKVRENVLKRGVKRNAQGQPTGRLDPKEFTQNISQYGLCNHHIPLLQGITLAPERRTGVIRSLGPLCQAIMMVMEDKYFDKLSSALRHSLMMLPMNNEIITCLKEASTPGRAAGVLKELGDILLMTTARSTQKIYFPILLFIVLWRSKGNYAFSFSGSDVMKLYNDVVSTKSVKFVMRSGSSPDMTSEVIFHAMFGTYLEDLKVLESITNKHTVWHTRKELNNVFIKRSTQKTVTFTPITFTLISKMAQSLLTKTLGNVEPCATSRPSFSGFRTRVFTQDFLTYLVTGKSAQNYSSDPMQLQYALKKIKDQLVQDKDSIKMLESGTKAWEKENMGTWEECDEVPVEGDKKIFGAY